MNPKETNENVSTKQVTKIDGKLFVETTTTTTTVCKTYIPYEAHGVALSEESTDIQTEIAELSTQADALK